jgi:hypothetical protein
MHYRELELEPVERMNKDEREVSWVSGGRDDSAPVTLVTQTDALDTRLIQLIKALDR